MIGELDGDETGMVDYKAMHCSLDSEKSLKVYSKKPTFPDFCFQEITLRHLCGKFT